MLYNLIFWGVPAAALSVYLLLILFFAISINNITIIVI